MKERPILFSASMVNAILDGRKTQTRRIMKYQPMPLNENNLDGYYVINVPRRGIFRSRKAHGFPAFSAFCPYGKAGDSLWVREAWSTHACLDHLRPSELKNCRSYHYWANGEIQTGKKRPSIHMPRFVSRISLEITGIRVERLQDISEIDAIAEGIERTITGDGWRRYADKDTESAGIYPCVTEIESYRSLWESLNGIESWNANPWVWVVEFKRIEL